MMLRKIVALALVGLTAGCSGLSAINAQGLRFDGSRFSGTSEREFAYQTRNSPGFRAVYLAAVAHDVDPALMLAMAKKESGGNCGVTSPKGAKGVLQVMPGTALKHGVSKRQLGTCEGSAKAGVREMAYLLRKYKSKRLALIAYNCGEGCIRRSRLPKETRNYLKVLHK
jgi:soluble lytic murein transglycosylase-like protein